MTISRMTKVEIEKGPTDNFNEKDWTPLVNFFWERYNKRYFNQIECLQNHSTNEISNNCGFIIASIDCILIETLEQFYSGEDESKGKNHDPFLLFFTRAEALKTLNFDKDDAGKFVGFIRSGLLHQSKTKKASIINKRPSTPILAWIDVKDKSKGFQLNRDKFHKCVCDEYRKLISELEREGNSDLRSKFKSKLITLI